MLGSSERLKIRGPDGPDLSRLKQAPAQTGGDAGCTHEAGAENGSLAVAGSERPQDEFLLTLSVSIPRVVTYSFV